MQQPSTGTESHSLAAGSIHRDRNGAARGNDDPGSSNIHTNVLATHTNIYATSHTDTDTYRSTHTDEITGDYGTYPQAARAARVGCAP